MSRWLRGRHLPSGCSSRPEEELTVLLTEGWRRGDLKYPVTRCWHRIPLGDIYTWPDFIGNPYPYVYIDGPSHRRSVGVKRDMQINQLLTAHQIPFLREPYDRLTKGWLVNAYTHIKEAVDTL